MTHENKLRAWIAEQDRLAATGDYLIDDCDCGIHRVSGTPCIQPIFVEAPGDRAGFLVSWDEWASVFYSPEGKLDVYFAYLQDGYPGSYVIQNVTSTLDDGACEENSLPLWIDVLDLQAILQELHRLSVLALQDNGSGYRQETSDAVIAYYEPGTIEGGEA